LLSSHAGLIALTRSSALSGASESAMSELHSLESLEALHADLLALSESRLLNVERLGIQLEIHIQDFRALLDKKARNEQSRKSLETGTGETMNEP